MNITGTLMLDLRAKDQPLRSASTPLAAAPDGCRVALVIRDDQLPDVLAYWLVRDELARLGEINVWCGDAATIRMWHAVLRGDDPWQGVA